MKKRILSILLAALMVMTTMTFVVPVSAAGSGTTKTSPYTYQFEETDIRNIIDGQVFDVEAKGESTVAPVMDGVINKDEYAVSGTIPFEAHDIATRLNDIVPDSELDFHFAVKDGYLYVAFTYEGDTEQRSIQYDIGVVSDHRSDGAFTRKQVTWKSDNTLGDHGWLMKAPGTDTWASGSSVMYSSEFLLDKAYSNGTYEAKFDLVSYYKLFSASCRGKGIFESPCVVIGIFYNPENAKKEDGSLPSPETVQQSHYAFKITPQKIDSECKPGWVPATIIIPKESLVTINLAKNVIGNVGDHDWRNAVAGQLINLTEYATTLPTINGTIAPNEYQKSQYYAGTSRGLKSGFTMYASVGLDGLVYIGLEYEQDTHANIIVQPGVTVNSSASIYSRSGVTLTTTGGRSNQNNLFYKASAPGSWTSDTFGIPNYSNVPRTDDPSKMVSNGSANWTRPDVAAATTNTKVGEKNITVYEFSLSITKMIASYEDAGWCADMANCVSLMFYFNSNNVYSTGGSDVTDAAREELNKYSGFGIDVNYYTPSVGLPADAIERFRVDSITSLQGYGQVHLNAGASTAALDGVIGASEYTASYPYTAGNITGTNYFAADADYIYIASKFVDPNFAPSTTADKDLYQLDLNLLGGITGDHYDHAYAITRVNPYVKVMADGSTYIGQGSAMYRSQEDKAGSNSTMAADMSAKNGFTAKHSWDDATDTAVVEVRIDKDALRAAYKLDANDPIDQITYFHYHPTNAKWVYINDTDLNARVNQTLNYQTYKSHVVYARNLVLDDNNTVKSLPYANGNADFYPKAVVNFTGFETKGGASARLSATSMEKSGLRFQTVYTDAYLNQMKALAEAYGETLEIGTLIAPADYVTAAGEFTHEALAKKYTTSTPYVEVKATLDAPFATGNGTTTYAGSIVNINDKTRDFAGIGYIKIGDNYFYSESYCVRNVARIATDALADKSATQTDVYKYQLSDGKFSPYAPGQIIILEGLKSN